MDLVLDESASVTLDANGNGTVQLGPRIVREHWKPNNVAVSASTYTKDAQCQTFMGTSIVAAELISTSQTGSSGDNCGMSDIDMQPGTLLISRWTGGDVGATATMHVTGTRVRPS